MDSLKLLLGFQAFRSCRGFSVSKLVILSLLCLVPGPSFDTAAAAIPNYDRVRVLDEPRLVEDAELTDQEGRRFRLSQLRGQVSLVFFGFTNCPDVCPLAMQNFRQLEKEGGPDIDDVAFVLISVDGDRDTPDVLKAYLKPFSSRFIGLTGEPRHVKAIAKDFSVAFFKGSELDNSGSYNVLHSPQIFAIDATGRLRAEFYNASTKAMIGVTSALLTEAKDVSATGQKSKD